MNKISSLLIIFFLLISCSHQKNMIHNKKFSKNIHGFDILIKQFAHDIEKLWGINEIIITEPNNYVKYADKYKTRSHINFNTGVVTIETIDNNNPIKKLHQAIIKTLLMNNSYHSIEFNSDTNGSIDKPLLYDKVLDHNGKSIRGIWRASRFADHLLEKNLKIRNLSLNSIWSTTIRLIKNYSYKDSDQNVHKYLDIVRQASQNYEINPSLILAIIHAESNFNPYAISRSNALGLMQVIQHSAGRDVFKMQGKWGYPTRSDLFDPEKNIHTGTAYLGILQNTYLSNIENPISRCYAVIISYHSGVNSVLRIFSNDQDKAFKIINSMQPDDVYQILYTCHPSEESRRYLYKVNLLRENYQFYSNQKNIKYS